MGSNHIGLVRMILYIFCLVMVLVDCVLLVTACAYHAPFSHVSIDPTLITNVKSGTAEAH